MSTKTYAIDKAHSEVTFQVRHLITKVRGHFEDFAGTIVFDAANPVNSKVDFTIQAASINTKEAQRDGHLKGDDFFSVEKFPVLTFHSTSIAAKNKEDYDVTGNLTIRDVTKEVVLPITHLGTAKDPWGNEKLAFEGETVIDRKEFGLHWNAALEAGGFLVGDDVKISLQIQAA